LDLERDGHIRIDRIPVGSFQEQRPVPLVEPSLRYFSEDDLSYLDAAIEHFWDHSGRGVSRQSHGVAWETRFDGDPMPYDLALLSDEKLTGSELERFVKLGRERGWRTH
jgi:hypothetical protein